MFENVKMKVKNLGIEKNVFSEGDAMNAYRITLKYKGKQFSFSFYTGIGFKKELWTTDVLKNIFYESQAGEETSVQNFMQEFGYEDYEKASKVLKGCQKINKNLHRLFGADYSIIEKEMQRTLSA